MSEYVLSGLDCAALNTTAFCIGYKSVAGGSPMTFSAYDSARRMLTIAEGNPGKCGPNVRLRLWTCANDENSPYDLRIVKADGLTVYLDRAPEFSKEALEKIAEWVGAVPDVRRYDTALASGEGCFATGEYSFASGAYCLASACGAHAEGVLCEARGEMSFSVGNCCVASGMASSAAGTNCVASGMFSAASGSSSTASGDNSRAEGAGCEASGDTSRASGFASKARGRLSFAHGANAEANAGGSIAIGSQLVNNAPGAALLGTHGKLEGAVDNIGAIVIAGGTRKEQRLPLILRVNKSVANPLFPQEGEAPFLPEPEFSMEYAGHLLAHTVSASGTTLVMDHGVAGRWKFTPSGQTVPQLKNWVDGDSGELIILNGGSRIAFPSAWKWSGDQPELKSSGTDVFTIRKINETIIIKHEAYV